MSGRIPSETALPRADADAAAAAEDQPAPESREVEWIRLAREGDRDAFAALATLHGPRILRYLLRFTRNPHDVEDLAQNTFLKAFRALPNFRRDAGFLPWLFTIARRTALNHLRDTRPAVEITPETWVDHSDPARLAVAREDEHALWRAARELKPAQYEALWLHYAEGLSIPETARVMGRPALYLRVLLHRARQQLAKKITPELLRGCQPSSPGIDP